MPGIDNYDKIVLQFKGANNSISFVDSSENDYDISIEGDAKISTAQYQFGGSSLALDGNGDYLTVEDSADLDLSSADFSIITRVRLSDTGNNTICARTSSGSSYFYLTFEGTSLRFRDYGDGGSVDFSRTLSISTNTWYHILITRHGNDFRIFLDGVQQGATYTTSASMVDRNVGLDVGHMTQNSGYAFNGYIDEFVWTKGIARYTENFTPDNHAYGNYGEDETAGKTASASSQWGSPSLPPSNAIDDNPSTHWAGNGSGFPYWWKVDLGEGNEKSIKQYTLRSRADSYWNEIPKTFKLQASNNDADWTDLDDQTDLTWTQAETKHLEILNPSSYRYYRIYMTASFGGGGNAAIAEIELMESIVVIPDETLDIDETINISESFNFQTNPEQEGLAETLNISDSWRIQESPQSKSIEDTAEVSEDWEVDIYEKTYNILKVISYNPLIFVTNTTVAKIVKIDISDPENPIKSVYFIDGCSFAKDVILNAESDYFYVICDDGKVVKILKTDLDDQTVIDTLDLDELKQVTSIDSNFQTFVSTDDASGELILIDERELKTLNTDLRFSIRTTKRINSYIDFIFGRLINTDLRVIAEITSKISTDLRWLEVEYDSVIKNPINRTTDWVVKINNVDITVLDDVDMNSIRITHAIDQESQASLILHRRHDKLNYTNTNVYNQITNNNSLQIYIKNRLEFGGKISNISANSEEETVIITALMTEPTAFKNSITLALPSVNEKIHLYHCLKNNIQIDNPYIDPDDENPQYYKGIEVDLGVYRFQRGALFSSSQKSSEIAEQILDETWENLHPSGSFFWYGKFENFVTGKTWGAFSNIQSRYIGTSLSELSSDTYIVRELWYQTQYTAPDGEEELGIYRVGEAPYSQISCQNGKHSSVWRMNDDGKFLTLYLDEYYDYVNYAKQVAALEYEKIQNINGDVLPITSANIEISLNAYYFYKVKLLSRMRLDNTTSAKEYKNRNGFPVAVKSIDISSSSMTVQLTCDNQKSQKELDDIDARYPNEENFITPKQTWYKLVTRFDPREWDESE